MVHDFLVTRRHALFPILPLTGDPERAMRGGPALRLGARQGRAYRGDGARRRRRDDALVHHRRLLRLPPDERLGRRRQDLRRRDGISGRAAVPQRRRLHAANARPRAWSAGPSTSPGRPTRSSANRSTTWPANFRASTNAGPGSSYRHGWFAARTGGRDGSAFDGIAHSTSKREGGRPMSSRAAMRRASRSSSPARPMRRKAMDGSSRWSTAPRRIAAILPSSTPARSKRGRSGSPNCRVGFRSVSTETGGRASAFRNAALVSW